MTSGAQPVIAVSTVRKRARAGAVRSGAESAARRILFVAVLFMAINLAVDLLYSYLDPRIRYSG